MWRVACGAEGDVDAFLARRKLETQRGVPLSVGLFVFMFYPYLSLRRFVSLFTVHCSLFTVHYSLSLCCCSLLLYTSTLFHVHRL